MGRRIVFGLALSLAAGWMHVAYAADPVTATLSAQRVLTQANGKEKLASAEQAKPGDTLEYRVDYHNTMLSAVGNVVATLPIPRARA